MADFPAKVNTHTSAASQQGNSQLGNVTMQVDVTFIKTIPAILMLAEIVVGLLVWPLVSSAHYYVSAAIGWVLFVTVTTWLLTTVLFFLLLLGVHKMLPAVPWALLLMIYHAVAAVLYLTAFITTAVSATGYYWYWYHGHMSAAAFFSAAVTVLYGASTFFSYMTWKGDGGNAAGSTVPV
ncbi:hypothetical protein ACEWY4_010487 [Coilia grayii]|uniref:Plasmolipin n=1 Tax=Coilia grayii TaxID=363190 RepID=A0ABD1K221_9TELE